MGKLKAKALLSSLVIWDTLTFGGIPAIAAAVAASAAAIFRFRSLEKNFVKAFLFTNCVEFT